MRTLDGPVVFLFTQTDCPISNRYAPELKRLYLRFEPQGVKFWTVYPDPAETAESIRQHLRSYELRMPALRDRRHSLVRFTLAAVTPEAAVFIPTASGPRMIYRGRIDDRFVAFGQTRPAPTTRDLEEVLEAVIAGSPPKPKTTPAVGCFIADLR